MLAQTKSVGKRAVDERVKRLNYHVEIKHDGNYRQTLCAEKPAIEPADAKRHCDDGVCPARGANHCDNARVRYKQHHEANSSRQNLRSCCSASCALRVSPSTPERSRTSAK